MNYQVPGETKERAVEEDTHPFCLNDSTLIKHSDVQMCLRGEGMGALKVIPQCGDF